MCLKDLFKKKRPSHLPVKKTNNQPDFSSGTSYDSSSESPILIITNIREQSPRRIIKSTHNVYVYDDIKLLDNTFFSAYFKNNIIIFVNNSSRLPLDGWLQTCIKCGTITGRKMLYKEKKDEKIFIKMCLNCIHNFKHSSKTLSNIVLKEEIDEIILRI